MNRTSYGKSWWGGQWLHALSHIDFDNRLPRGRSYASKGAVRDLVVTGGSVEAQATDRAYRIGQQRNVQVHRLITRASFEERINDMMRAKRELADLTVGSGEQWIGHLPMAELKELFALG